MNAALYCEILQRTLIPFIQDNLPAPFTHRFMQDNDPKHTTRLACKFFEDHQINWWHTPPESSDANPIENLWHELKEFIRREVKPRYKEQLADGICRFWATVTPTKSCRYIGHLRKILPLCKLPALTNVRFHYHIGHTCHLKYYSLLEISDCLCICLV